MIDIKKIFKGIKLLNNSDATKKVTLEVQDAYTGDLTVRFPAESATQTMLTDSATQTVTNKTIDADSNTITNIDNADIKAGAAIDATKIADGSVSNTEFQYLGGVTSDIQTQLNSKASGTDLTNHTSASSDVHGVGVGNAVVGTGTTQTLTNKSIDADSNTITNIDNNDIKASAGIDATKIANGSVSNTEFESLDGITGNIQLQLDSKAGVSLDNLTGTAVNADINPDGNATRDLGSNAENWAQVWTREVLSNDELSIDANSGTGGSKLSLKGSRLNLGPQAASDLASPSEKDFYYNTASKKFRYYNGTTWLDLGSGSSATNYIANGQAETATSGWATYADAAGTAPVDGTGGSPNVTITRSTSSPLSGTGSFLLTKDAANRQGQGWSYAFTIDAKDQARVLQINFDYLINSGTFVAGTSSSASDVTVWIYDVTNSTVIQPSSIKLFSNSTSIADRFSGYFQTASNSTSYRLIIHVGSTSASAYELKVDNVSVSPSEYVYGTPITDWQSYTPALTSSGGGAITLNGTGGTSPNGYWRRVGSNVEIQFGFRNGTGGAATGNAGNVQIGFPAGIVTVGSGIANNGAVGTAVGYAQVYTGSVYTGLENANVSFSSSFIALQNDGTASYYSVSDIAAGWGVTGFISVQVAGWSASVQMSNNADTRVVACQAYRTANQTGINPNGTYVKMFPTSAVDTHGAFNTSTGTYTIPVSGWYEIEGQVYMAGTNVINNLYLAAVYVNNSVSIYGQGVYPPASAGMPYIVAGKTYLNAGSTVELYLYGQGNNSVNTLTATVVNLSISRVSGPSAIGANETVALYAYGTSGTTIPNNSLTTVPFQTKGRDTHNAYNTSTGQYVIPVAGVYAISAITQYNSISATGGATIMCRIIKNGASVGENYFQLYNGDGGNLMVGATNLAVPCNAGDIITIGAYQTVQPGGANLATSGSTNYVSIARIGL